ncbi:MAG: PDGLE domain-containing protein [Armatimonadetes bacterium]|nr:PDGLE domain-containing protein [Armatimonadota bacterium]MDW8029632.1 PDGLE domain-containing protein [Armatimonadota bacterium]
MKQNAYLLAFVAIVLATIALLPFASELPDGLERVAEMFGFAERERQVYSAPLKDYTLPKFGGFFGQAIAAVVGISVTSGLVWLLASAIKKVKGKNA